MRDLGKGLFSTSKVIFIFKEPPVDKLIVFLIIVLAAGYIIRRFFFKKQSGCGCGCSGGCDASQKKGSCCGDGPKPL